MNDKMTPELQTIFETVDHLSPEEVNRLKAYVDQRLKLLNEIENLPDATQALVQDGRLTRRHKRFCEG